ncbi:glycosyltransferase family 2 protein [Chryseobacterium taklimakanense]|uniref:glycosyltransferase family 2 protein n=1 Tax=Chryseobacterium taklimakanense TaxID=536441 RepID=UPI0023F76C25|nr:glycosyltransferase family 2 protein [Chryseobacterium taklimakanense]
MTFSILIAHYNNFAYFTECYRSILKQTYQNFEVILVDDCSTDGSLEKIRELAVNDPRVKIFKNEQNKGVGFTKRRCAENASGEICGFVDPDDAIVENALERSITEYQDPEIVATHSQFQICDSRLKINRLFPSTKSVKNKNPKFFNINLEVNHFFTFRKSAYDRTSGINADLTSAVDQDLYLKLYETGNFKYIKEPLYLYRLHDKGVSQDQSKKEKLNKNWQTVLQNACERRSISNLYGRRISEIKNLPEFIFKKQNTLISKILKRLS